MHTNLLCIVPPFVLTPGRASHSTCNRVGPWHAANQGGKKKFSTGWMRVFSVSFHRSSLRQGVQVTARVTESDHGMLRTREERKIQHRMDASLLYIVPQYPKSTRIGDSHTAHEIPGHTANSKEISDQKRQRQQSNTKGRPGYRRQASFPYEL